MAVACPRTGERFCWRDLRAPENRRYRTPSHSQGSGSFPMIGPSVSRVACTLKLRRWLLLGRLRQQVAHFRLSGFRVDMDHVQDHRVLITASVRILRVRCRHNAGETSGSALTGPGIRVSTLLGYALPRGARSRAIVGSQPSPRCATTIVPMETSNDSFQFAIARGLRARGALFVAPMGPFR